MMVDMMEVCKKAIENYGVESQIMMVMEEMSELQKELCKNYRGKENSTCIAEEIADVEIMLEQMKILFDVHEQSKKFLEFKLQRLMKRLEVV
nr:hypothetical protein [Acutalibacter sp. 1XD8-36]